MEVDDRLLDQFFDDRREHFLAPFLRNGAIKISDEIHDFTVLAIDLGDAEFKLIIPSEDHDYLQRGPCAVGKRGGPDAPKADRARCLPLLIPPARFCEC